MPSDAFRICTVPIGSTVRVDGRFLMVTKPDGAEETIDIIDAIERGGWTLAPTVVPTIEFDT